MILQWLHHDNGVALKKLAELISVNKGQMETFHIGPPVPTDAHKYKRFNLNVQEAMELNYLRGLFEGILMATGGQDSEMAQKAIQKEINGITIEIVTGEAAKRVLATPVMNLKPVLKK